MCQRYSWIEKDGKVVFLTADDVFKSKRGKQLQKHTCQDDWHGHGAIRWYYNFTGGKERECTDFSSPKNFPPELVAAIKNGKMWGFGITFKMCDMLVAPARKKYDAVVAPAWKKYKAVEAPARKKYETAMADALAAPAWKKYKAVEAPAREKYDAAMANAFAKIFSDPTNRKKVWR